MATKHDLKDWVIEALLTCGGKAHHIDVAKHIWVNHRADLETSGDLFYTWQYDMRWAADNLRREGRLLPKPKGDTGPWQLTG
jgi:hypothetical protein